MLTRLSNLMWPHVSALDRVKEIGVFYRVHA